MTRSLDESWSGYCADVTVYAPDHTRISALLGPDGEPLRVPYARPKLGFDLTPKGKKRGSK